MIIENSTICFRSFPENYTVEKSGLKQNSLRLIPRDELPNFKIIDGSLFVNGVHIKYIKISNTQTFETFTRTITNVTQLNEYFIFSWNETINAVCIPSFSQCQQIKLDANNHKTPCTLLSNEYIIKRLMQESQELYNEVFNPDGTEKPIDPIKVCDEAIDVANFALFLFTKYPISPSEYQAFILSKYDQIRRKQE